MQEPLFSIIIPTYNRAHLIGETLDSIAAQSYTNWECIIVDDGSTDDTEALITAYVNKDSRFQYHKRPSNKIKGPNSCRNYGVLKSNGDIINFLDSDDMYTPNILMNVIEKLGDNTVDAIIVKADLVDFENSKILKSNTITSNNLVIDHFMGKINFYVCGPFWSKDFLLNQEQLFDEHVTNGDDWDFNLRMLYAKPRLDFIEEPLINYRCHDKSLAKEKLKLNKFELESQFSVMEKHLTLIKKIKGVDISEVKHHIESRYFKYFKRALFQNHKNRFWLFRQLVYKQLKFLYFGKALKSITGFLLYNYFKKGYRFLRE